jgi:hypothetical protein
VAARSVLCYFLVRELGLTATAVGQRLRIGQPAVSIAVSRGEAIVKEKGLSLPAKEEESDNSMGVPHSPTHSCG